MHLCKKRNGYKTLIVVKLQKDSKGLTALLLAVPSINTPNHAQGLLGQTWRCPQVQTQSVRQVNHSTLYTTQHRGAKRHCRSCFRTGTLQPQSYLTKCEFKMSQRSHAIQKACCITWNTWCKYAEDCLYKTYHDMRQLQQRSKRTDNFTGGITTQWTMSPRAKGRRLMYSLLSATIASDRCRHRDCTVANYQMHMNNGATPGSLSTMVP